MNVFILLRDFMDAGGDVLWGILLVTVLMWCLLLDRFWFFLREYRPLLGIKVQQWQQETDKHSWFGESIRRQLVSEVDIALARNLKVIPSLIALLPMLGLLGTVTGMIQVFDVLAITGSSNPRSMADGVSAATIPTMAGMVAALTAMPFSSELERRYRKEQQSLNEAMASAVGTGV
jgi:biopolymer transport protein ExbB